ncbi:MAG: thioesterase [Subtercola sp.]|nr:thioesterase [Subtercola sp.]
MTTTAETTHGQPSELALQQAAAANRGRGALAETMRIEFLEVTPEYPVATMPVEGNTQPFGVVHGGAYVVLAESMGSFAAYLHAGEGFIAMGIEVNASHTGSATEGMVTGVCTAIKLGRTLTVHEVALSDEKGRRLSTVRITNLIRKV